MYETLIRAECGSQSWLPGMALGPQPTLGAVIAEGLVTMAVSSSFLGR